MKIILKAYNFYIPRENVSAFQDTPEHPHIKSKIHVSGMVGFYPCKISVPEIVERINNVERFYKAYGKENETVIIPLDHKEDL